MRQFDDALALIGDLRELLGTLSDPPYASAEDCAHFREKLKKKRVEVAPLPPFVSPPPPKPVIAAAPPPLPPKKEAPPPSVPVIEEKKQSLAPQTVEIPIPALSKDWRDILKKVAPTLAIFPDIPSDTLAKKINSQWKTKNQTAPITILCDQEPPEQKALLKNIAKALDIQFGLARLVSAEPIEKENQWEAFLSVEELKLVVCCDYTLWQLPKLRTHFKEVPAQKNRLLGTKAIFLLPDLSLYLKDPLLKRSLWKALCHQLYSYPSSSTKT
ncbi:MAG: hypothetical protein KGJ02_01540 [Verrucomicrobiota bacterium]|nr:hypothetical protein [Verrucomicrobiota bacterium]